MHPCLKTFTLSVLALLGCGPIAHAGDTLSIDWSSNKYTANNLSYGLGLFHGSNYDTTGNSVYASNIGYMKPGIVRVHSAAMMLDTKMVSDGWVYNPGSNYAWDSNKIIATINNIQSYHFNHDILLNIPNWPTYFNDPSNSSHLDPAKYDEYANWCGQLVTIIKNAGLHVKYWEPTNELDSSYNDDLTEPLKIWTKCRNAMKTADPTIQVGGLAIAHSYNFTTQQAMVDGLAGVADFMSNHAYALSSSNDSNAQTNPQIYYGARIVADYYSANFAAKIRASSAPSTPLLLDEYNIDGYVSNNGGSYNPDVRQTNGVSGVFDAIVMTTCAYDGVAGSMAFNEKDGWYGKMDDALTLRPAANVYNLLNTYFLGTYVSHTWSDANSAEVQGVKTGTQHNLCYMNLSSGADTVTTSFTGWNAPLATTSFQTYTLDGTGFHTGTVTYSALVNGFTLPVDSVTFVVIPDSSLGVPNPVADSGFESPAQGPGNFSYNTSGAPWTFVGSSGISANGSGFTGANPSAPEGTQVGFVQQTGQITQNVPGFAAGVNYTLTASAAKRASYGGNQSLAVYLDTTRIGTITPGSTSYSTYSVGPFTATAGSHVLKFVGLNPSGGDNTAFLDDVRITH